MYYVLNTAHHGVSNVQLELPDTLIMNEWMVGLVNFSHTLKRTKLLVEYATDKEKQKQNVIIYDDDDTPIHDTPIYFTQSMTEK